MLEGANKNEQSRETGNTIYTRQTKPNTVFHLFIDVVCTKLDIYVFIIHRRTESLMDY